MSAKQESTITKMHVEVGMTTDVHAQFRGDWWLFSVIKLR